MAVRADIPGRGERPLRGDDGSETSGMTSGRGDSSAVRKLALSCPLANRSSVLYRFEDAAWDREGDRPLLLEAMSDNAHEASSAVSSLTLWEVFCAASAASGVVRQTYLNRNPSFTHGENHGKIGGRKIGPVSSGSKRTRTNASRAKTRSR